MARDSVKNAVNSTTIWIINSMSYDLSILENKKAVFSNTILENLLEIGIDEFCICPAGRNAPLIYPLVKNNKIKLYQWSEERSAAFFALGRIKATHCPVVVVTTSGTAAAELLPAVMEAYYTQLPLIVITADRPKRFRGSGAPQSAEHIGLFSHYVRLEKDIEEGVEFNLSDWDFKGPLHVNICLEEPKDADCKDLLLSSDVEKKSFISPKNSFSPHQEYLEFIKNVEFPFVVVSTLPENIKENAIRFLLHLNAPIYLEAQSGLREEKRLEGLSITCESKIWALSRENNYLIDGILRLGGIPTTRLWRDIEERKDLRVCSISNLPFSGLSERTIKPTCLESFMDWAIDQKETREYDYERWFLIDHQKQGLIQQLFDEEPLAEPSMIHHLSKKIPRNSKVYLGNSLPIREWDLAAIRNDRNYRISSNRGVNGIDGQLATFLGYASKEQDNWAFLGDLTLLYDMVAPWIFNQLEETSVNVVVINNQGGQIFSRMYSDPVFINSHALSFKYLAKFWNWHFEQWEIIPQKIATSKNARLIELKPHPKATERFWKCLQEL